MMHIPSLKKVTKQIPIRELAPPPVVFLPLKGYKGVMQPLVQPGDTVKKYQVVAQSDDAFATVVHAPVSGIVEAIEYIDNQPHIKLVNDLMDAEVELPAITPDKLTAEDVIEILKNYGIEGSGGARFPTHLKYNTTLAIDTFIINGAECEPYLSADYALLKNDAVLLLKAIALLQKVVQAKQIVIAIEKQHKELTAIIKPYFKAIGLPVTLKLLPNEYPQGGELQLIKSVTGKELPKGSIPAQHGVVVSNIGTLWAVYNAVYYNKPYTERIITFSGENATVKGNYLVKIGTPVSFIMQQLGNNWDSAKQTVIMGGPMMGKAAKSADVPVNKGTGGILLLPNPETENYNCIQCGYCADVCPQHLMPMEFARREGSTDKKRLLSYHVADCIECGACAYICPSDVPLMHGIFSGKELIATL